MRHLFAIAFLLLVAFVAYGDAVSVAPRETGPSAGPNGRPFLVADGDELVVVWDAVGQSRFARIRQADEILLSGDFGRPGVVRYAVAGPNGSVIAAFSDADGIHIANVARNGDVHMSDVVAPSFSSMAWNGSALLVVTRAGNTILTDAHGLLLGHGAQLALFEEGRSSASARGDGFVVAWAERNALAVVTLGGGGNFALEQRSVDRSVADVAIGCEPSGKCLLLSSAGEPLTGQIVGETIGDRFLIGDYTSDMLAPVWDGQRWLVTWFELSLTENSALYEVLVSSVTPDRSVTPLASIAPNDRTRSSPAVAHANGHTIVAMRDHSRCAWSGDQVLAHSLTTGTELLLTRGLSTQQGPVIAAGTSTALVAWTELGGISRVRARLFPFTEPAFDVSSGPAAATPAIASDGSGYLVAWYEALPEDDCRKAIRVSAIGSGTTFTLARNADPYTSPQITWNGSEYVVLWEQDDPAELFAMRVDRNGQPLDATPVSLTLAEKEPDSFTTIDHEPAGLFWTGNGYLLVWRRSRSAYIPWYPDPPPQFDIRTTLLAPNLFPAAAPQSVAPVYNIVATMKGADIVALWRINCEVRAVRLSPEGTVLAERELGFDFLPLRILPTRTGYVVLSYNEILFLDDSLAPRGRRPTQGIPANVADTAYGLVEVYTADDTVYLSAPPSRRRRSVR